MFPNSLSSACSECTREKVGEGKALGREGAREWSRSVFAPDVSLARAAFAPIACGRRRAPGMSSAGPAQEYEDGDRESDRKREGWRRGADKANLKHSGEGGTAIGGLPGNDGSFSAASRLDPAPRTTGEIEAFFHHLHFYLSKRSLTPTPSMSILGC